MAISDGFIDSLKQQKLPSHQCSFGPIFVFCLTFFLGIFCVGVGMIFTNAASQIRENVTDYTIYDKNSTVEFSVNLTGFNRSVYIYYELERFYQLRLSMRNSYDFNHFANADYEYICTGETNEQRDFRLNFYKFLPSLSDFIDKFLPRYRGINHTAPVPCGHRDNLFFNDTVKILDDENREVPFTNENISTKRYPLFSSQIESKLFKNPAKFDSRDPCKSFFNNYTKRTYDKPKYWREPICKLPNAMENEDFIVWMTPSYASTFRKPWKILDLNYTSNKKIKNNMSTKNYSDGLPDGIYKILIENRWTIPMNSKGQPLYRKKIVITTVNWAGGKNNFLGIAYLVVGIIILFIGCGLAIAQSFNPSYLRDQNIEQIRWRKNA